MDELGGRTAVVTGAASGMGLAFARRFARAGMNVVLADIEEPVLAEAVAAVAPLTTSETDAVGVITDVGDAGSVDELAATAIERFDRVNVVCNNAGVAGGMSGDPGQLDLASWRWVVDVNFWGVVHGHAAFLPHLLGHGDGHIVNTASMAGHFPGHNAYSATKWAVVAITEGLRGQLRAAGSTVGVSCLCPGWVDTRILDSDRNRPEWAAPPALAEPSEEVDAARARVRDHLAAGMAPDRVAELVHDAIVADQFWIFTDQAMVASLEARFDAVLRGSEPPPFDLTSD